jgi:hypothetical protein
MVLPHSLNAVSNDAESVINQPKFNLSSCAITLESVYPEGKTQWATGDKASFKIQAVNESSQDQDLTLSVSISATPPSSPLMRTIPMPREVESLPVSLHVPAGQAATMDLSCEKPLPAGSIRVQFVQGDSRLQMASITTAKDITFEDMTQNSINGQINAR